MRTVILPTKPDRRHPLIDQSGVLPSAKMICVADATGKGIVIDCSSPSLKPGKQTSSDLRRDFELHGSSSFLLDDHRPSSNFVAGDKCPDFQFYQIAAAELAVDGKIEKCPISHPSFTVQEEADCPDLALLQGLLDANLLACIPSRSTQRADMLAICRPASMPAASVLKAASAWLHNKEAGKGSNLLPPLPTSVKEFQWVSCPPCPASAVLAG